LRRFDSPEPVTLQKFGQFGVIFEVEWFDEEGIGAEFVGAIYVGNQIGGSENYDRDGADAGLLTDPGENVIAVGAGHFEVEEDEIRKGMLGAVGVSAIAAQILDGCLTASDYMELVGHGGVLEGPSDKDDVIFEVLDQ
jgi:hypothetical protein